MSRGVTLIIAGDDAERYKDWTPCEAFRLEPLKDGTVKFAVKGIEPAAEPVECDWCSGKGYVVQVGPNHQEAKLPCSNCGGTGLQ